MKPQEIPVHINAKKEDIAPLVLLPGDPLRAKYIAENFLENAKEVTNLRNMLGFTGTYKGVKVTVMSSGMGMPSAGIYAFELFYFYNVQKIIRIGTCGICDKSVKIPEIILADKVFTESKYAYFFDGFTGNIECPSHNLVNKISDIAKDKGIKIHKGTIMTTDVFSPYTDEDALLLRVPSSLKVLAIEMEAFGLIHIANSFKREAAVLATGVDSKFSNEIVTPKMRQTSLNEMIGLALDSII